VWSTVAVTFKDDRGHGNSRTVGESLLESVILRFAVSEAEPPTIVVNHDADMIRIVEGRRAAIERRVIELPSLGRELPDEFPKSRYVS